MTSTGLSKTLSDSVHYHRRADIDLAYNDGEDSLFNGRLTLDLEKIMLNANNETTDMAFIAIDSTVSYRRMLDSQPEMMPGNAEYIDYLVTIHVKDFVHPGETSSAWDTPVLKLNLNNAQTDQSLTSFDVFTLGDLVNFNATEFDTLMIVRMGVQSLRGSQLYSRIDLLGTKQPFITEVYNFDSDIILSKNRGLMVCENTTREQVIPENYALFQNYPNPFNAETAIKYDLPQSAHVILEIYNIMGQKVRSLVNEQQPAGQYRIHWDSKDDFGRTALSGIYMLKIKADQYEDTRKMIIIR